MTTDTTHKKAANGMGSVYQDRTRGCWVAALPVDGKKRIARCRTELEAIAKLTELRHQAANGWVPESGERVADTMAAFIRRKRAEAANHLLSDGSVRNIESVTRNWIVPQLGALRLRDLRKRDVQVMLDAMANAGRGRDQITNARNRLAQAIDEAIDDERANRNVARLAYIPACAEKGAKRSLDEAQAATFMAEAARAVHRLGNFLIVSLALGLRTSEAKGLRWADVNLDAGTVLIRGTKSGRALRELGLPAVAIAALRDQRRRQAAEELAATGWHNPQGLVFTSPTGAGLSRKAVQDALDAVTAAAGVGRLTSHELRHTAASLLIEAGVPLQAVADFLGHADIKQLARTYRHKLRPVTNHHVAALNVLWATA